MKPNKLRAFLETNQRGLASAIVAVLLFNVLLVVSRSLEPGATDLAGVPGQVIGDDVVSPVDGEASVLGGSSGKGKGKAARGVGSGSVAAGGTGGTGETGRKVVRKVQDAFPIGVTEDEIHIVYYWKGERTMTSPYLGGTDAEGQNLDEGLAFKRYIEFINKHDGDGTTFMGIPIELHGRKLVGTVIEAGNGDYSYAQAAERIVKELKPFAAIAAHGSLSAYICPELAKAGIHNAQTYDLGGLGGTLIERTDGYCIPSGLSWERQVDLTTAYLKEHKDTPTTTGQERVYGVIYSVYPGLKDVAPAMVNRLKAAGIPIAAVAKLPADLATSQQQAPNIIAQMRNAGVNTLIMPDAGAPLNITHAAQANQYYPDYYIWPCSGEDTTGMVRLFNPAQWDRAEGLTCYDYEFNMDLFNNDKAERTEWWAAYQEIAGSDKEPPSPAPLVYAGLYQVLAGVANAGPNLTVESFRAGMDAVKPYRYDSIDGRTKDPTNMLMGISLKDRSTIGDAAYLYWDTTRREAGGPTQGAYVYPEDHRYRRPGQF